MTSLKYNGLESYFKTEDGKEYLKIRDRFVYFVELSPKITSEVQDFERLFQEQKEHYEKNKRAFEIKKIFTKQDPNILQEIADLKYNLEGINWWTEALQEKEDELNKQG